MTPAVSGFNGQYKFLSNFQPCAIEFEGLTYPTVEHAYQAAKTNDNDIRTFICGLDSAGAAKRAGRNLAIRSDWEDVKVPIMRTLLRKKFYDPILRGALQATGDAKLVEVNYWHDNYWGHCICLAHVNVEYTNWLGKLLMEVRSAY